MAPIFGSLKLYGETDIQTVREKSLNLTAYLMYLIDEKLTKYGFSVGNPRDDAKRGGHVGAGARRCHPHQRGHQAQRHRARLPLPQRHPPAPIAFYTSYEDIYEMVERIIRIMETREYEKYENKIGSIA